ncbi:MAG TPA: acetolactate synthase small subunit [Candidatus Omnitrophica bacterium]|nr:acetolactate synthase small subunit [Candidatus Omnitrophota bacterium]
MKHTISILVENKFGVLARVAGLFSARGYNIDSLTVSETQDSTISRMTVVVNAEDEKILEQIKKQLNKLIDVITVIDFTKKEYIERELIFVKIAVDKSDLARLKKIAAKAKADILEKKEDFCIIELVADRDHINNFLGQLKDFKLVELVRSGRIAIAK